jgi:hypothetical protein
MPLLKRVVKQYGGFEEAIDMVGESCLDAFCEKIYLAFCREFTNATYMKSVEWLIRHFHASKKIALSALFFTQSEELHGKNLKNLTFYSNYYALFNALSSNLILCPYLPIGKIHRISHSQIFTDIDNYFVRHALYKQDVILLLNNLRLARELYSYHLPLRGSFVREGKELNADSLATSLQEKITPILQISDLLSYMSHFAWEKKIGKPLDEYGAYQTEVDELFFSFIQYSDHLGRHSVIDDDDYHRLGYVLTKWKTPFPISWFITEKLCEDLECGWEQQDEENGYDIGNVAQFLSRAINAP